MLTLKEYEDRTFLVYCRANAGRSGSVIGIGVGLALWLWAADRTAAHYCCSPQLPPSRRPSQCAPHVRPDRPGLGAPSIKAFHVSQDAHSNLGPTHSLRLIVSGGNTANWKLMNKFISLRRVTANALRLGVDQWRSISGPLRSPTWMECFVSKFYSIGD